MSQPNLGYGAPSEATINQVNTWMRSTPWYQSLLQSWGQNPNNVHLNDAQKTQIVRAAQANGVVVDEGKQEIDDSGNFRNQGHALRNTLIVAGIAGATIATMGAAGVFAGAAGAGAGAGAGAAAGTGMAALPGALTAVPALGGSAAAGVGASLAGAGAAGAAGAGAAGTGAAMAPAAAGIWGAGGAGTTAIGIGANLFGNLFGAHMQSGAASEAAAEQAAALKYSADLQAKGTADALAFQRSQAENAFLNNEASRHGNYDQWAARERRIGSVGDLLHLGLGPREIPNYVAGVDPNLGGSSGAPGGPGGAAASGGPTGVNWTASPDQLTAQVNAFFTNRGVATTETPYWVGKAAELVARGKELNDPAYADKRLNAANIFGGGASAPAAVAPRSVGSSLLAAPAPTPYAPTPIAAPLAVQPYQGRSPGSYLYAGGY